jgi:hypothetical protein
MFCEIRLIGTHCFCMLCERPSTIASMARIPMSGVKYTGTKRNNSTQRMLTAKNIKKKFLIIFKKFNPFFDINYLILAFYIFNFARILLAIQLI